MEKSKLASEIKVKKKIFPGPHLNFCPNDLKWSDALDHSATKTLLKFWQNGVRKFILRHIVEFWCQNLTNWSIFMLWFFNAKSTNIFYLQITCNSLFHTDSFVKNVHFQHLSFGLDLDGSNYFVLPFPPKFLLYSVGPKKYKISISKFIVVQRGPEAKTTIERQHFAQSFI